MLPADVAGGCYVDDEFVEDSDGKTSTLKSFSSNCLSTRVVVRAGSEDPNIYDYTTNGCNGVTEGGVRVTSLTGQSGTYAGISHIDFCFFPTLQVSKTAVPKFTRTWS
jgi:hypothetical protein